MIDGFRRLAQRVQILRVPSIIVGVACLASILIILFASDSYAQDRALMPSFVGLLWAVSLYGFIESFHSAPEKLTERQGLLSDFKHRLRRGWYWIKGLVFLASTAVALLITSRLLSIWLAEYGD